MERVAAVLDTYIEKLQVDQLRPLTNSITVVAYRKRKERDIWVSVVDVADYGNGCFSWTEDIHQ